MPNDGEWQALLEQILKFLAFLERPVVQGQLAALAIATLVAWLLSDGLWSWGGHRFSVWASNRLGEKGQRYRQHGVLFLQYLAFPVLGLVTVQVTVNIFEALGWRAALIADWGILFVFLLYYRLLIALLYISLGEGFMRRYHYHLLAPLFGLFIAYRVLNYLINIEQLSEIVLLEPFGNPIKVGAVVTAVAALYFLFYISRAIQDLLQSVIVPRTNADPNVINAALTIGRYLVIGGAIVIIAAALGADMTTLALISGGLSVGIGFGLQEIVANFISGILLLFEQSLRPGDVVSVEGGLGTVQNLGVRATTVRTLDNVEVIVPNQVFLTSAVTTYTKTDRVVRVKIPVGVSYGSDPKEIREVLLTVAGQHNLVQEKPDPEVRFMGFGDSSLDFQLEIWLDDPMLSVRITSDLRFMIWKAFAKHNIEIPFPQQDLHLRSGVPWEQLGANSKAEIRGPENTEEELRPNESVYSQAATRQA
jgi:small-conductance mechanosensitive channel